METIDKNDVKPSIRMFVEICIGRHRIRSALDILQLDAEARVDCHLVYALHRIEGDAGLHADFQIALILESAYKVIDDVRSAQHVRLSLYPSSIQHWRHHRTAEEMHSRTADTPHNNCWSPCVPYICGRREQLITDNII